MRADLAVQRVWEAANQEILNMKSIENSWAAYEKLKREACHKECKIHEDLLDLAEEHRARLRLSMEILKDLRELLEPSQDDDIKQRIETFLESLNQKIKADYSFSIKTLFQLPIDVKGFTEEVLEPIGDIYYTAHKRRKQRWAEKFAEEEKFITNAGLQAERFKEALEFSTNFSKNQQNKEEKGLRSIELEALFSGFKNF